MPSQKKNHRAGTASIVGLPNAGKSTLLNAIAGEPIAIVTAKAQTTRTMLNGVWTGPNAQIVFLDTPGLHASDTTLNRRMMQAVRASLNNIDVLIFVADAKAAVGEPCRQALDLIKKAEAPAILALSKVDTLTDKSKLLDLITQYSKLHSFEAVVPLSAKTGAGVQELIEEIVKQLPRGAPLRPTNHLTDVPSRFLAAEMIRKQILILARQEVPHSVAVLVDHWEDTNGLLKIMATIYVERLGQKTIIVGAQGAMIKQIGIAARAEIEAFFQARVFLQLFVKVKPGWRDQQEFLNELDWRRMANERDA